MCEAENESSQKPRGNSKRSIESQYEFDWNSTMLGYIMVIKYVQNENFYIYSRFFSKLYIPEFAKFCVICNYLLINVILKYIN